MKTIVTNIKKVLGMSLVFTIAMAGVVQSQEILPPDDPSQLQDLPLQFNMDTDAVDWSGFTFHDFEGSALARVDNPDVSEVNNSDFVLEYIKAGGQPWAGFFYNTDGEMNLNEDSEFRLKVWSPRADIQALIKLEMRDFPDVNTGDLFADIEVSGEWIEIVWNFSELLDIEQHADTPYDRVVMIMDIAGGSGDGSDNYIWYLDEFSYSGLATSTEQINSGIPQAVTLYQNFPNPFNPNTNIQYSLPERSHATLEVYNMLGQRIATLVNNTLPAGTHTANFDATGLTSGVYFYRLKVGNEVQTRKLTLIK